jgi:hypothetical protein
MTTSPALRVAPTSSTDLNTKAMSLSTSTSVDRIVSVMTGSFRSCWMRTRNVGRALQRPHQVPHLGFPPLAARRDPHLDSAGC